MDHVKVFQSEMDSLIKMKTPISKAKMSTITKGAMKAIKMYKHVVQAVEKFIGKCKPESKVPGLYIMDSIIRQSRHQYGVDKDLFAARFCKNICTTFQSLYKCPEEDKSKIVRVLNLWQKNGVLPTEVIQPLMDLAVNSQDPTVFQTVHKKVEAASVDYIGKKSVKSSSNHNISASSDADTPYKPTAKRKSTDNSSKELEAATSEASQMTLQQMQLQQLQQLQQQLLKQTAMLSQVQGENKTGVDTQLLSSLEQLTKQLLTSKESEKPVIDKKLLDYDYGESDDEEKPAQPGENVRALQEAMLMQQLKQMNEVLQKQQLKNAAPEEAPSLPSTNVAEVGGAYNPTPITRLSDRLSQEEQYDPTPPVAPHPAALQSGYQAAHGNRFHEGLGHHGEQQSDFHHHQPSDQQLQMPDTSPRRQSPPGRGHGRSRGGRDYNRRSRSRSRDRSRRDGDRSRDRDRSRERRDREERRAKEEKRIRDQREREQQDREKEWQRKKQGLPPTRPGHVIICSCTLWIGHLSKSSTERDLSELCERFGAISNIFLIKPRGCAYVTLENRIDASRACNDLPSTKIQGNRIKVAWATPKSISEDKQLKDFWEAKDGAAYIPWGQMPSDLTPLTESGEAFLDESSLPGALITKPKPVEEERKPDTAKEELPLLPGMGGIANTSVPSHIVMAGGALPPMQSGQMNLMTHTSLDPTGAPSMAPGAPVPSALPHGMQLIMQGQQAAAMQAGLVPVQMSDGQVRLVRPTGALPPGLMPGMVPGLPPGALAAGHQLPPGMAPAGQGLMQLPPGLIPLRPMAPVTLAGGQTQAGGNQLEQALHDLMNNKATIQALAGQRLNPNLPPGSQLAGQPVMAPTSISQVAQMQANLSQAVQMQSGGPLHAGAPVITQAGQRLIQPMSQPNLSLSQPNISMAQPNMSMPPPGMGVPPRMGAPGDEGRSSPHCYGDFSVHHQNTPVYPTHSMYRPNNSMQEDDSPLKRQPGSPNGDARSGMNDRGGPQRNRLSFDDDRRGQNMRGPSLQDMSGGGLRGPPPGIRGIHPGGDMRGPHPGPRGPPPDMSGPPPGIPGGPYGMRPRMQGGPGFGMWRGDRPPFNPRGGPPPGWNQDSPMRPGFGPRGMGPRPRFPFRGEEMDHDQQRDGDRNRSRDEDRQSGRGRERDDGSRRDRDYDKGRDRDSRSNERRSDERGGNDNDRNRVRGRDSVDMFSNNSDNVKSKENDESKSAKRSRWSNDPLGTSGLDDASHKLAKITALEIAQRLAGMSKSAEVIPKPEPEKPAKPVVDITKVDTEETVSNVLGQLYDDDDDDDDDDDEPPAAPPVQSQPEPTTEVQSAISTTDSIEQTDTPSTSDVVDVTKSITDNGMPDKIAETAENENGEIKNSEVSTGNDVPVEAS